MGNLVKHVWHTVRGERAELRTLFPHSADRGLEDLVHNAIHDLSGGHRCRRVGTHATRVGSGIALPYTLMVLCSRQGSDRVPVGEREDGHLRPSQELLDNDLAAWEKERDEFSMTYIHMGLLLVADLPIRRHCRP